MYFQNKYEREVINTYLLDNPEVAIPRFFAWVFANHCHHAAGGWRAKGVLWYSLPELEKEMQAVPQTFTGGIHVFFYELRGEMEEFLPSIK